MKNYQRWALRKSNGKKIGAGFFASPGFWLVLGATTGLIGHLIAGGLTAKPRYDGTLGEALTKAVSHEDLREVRRLLNSGADPNTRSDGQPVLNRAAAMMNSRLCHLLISAGANPRATGHDGATPVLRLVEAYVSGSNEKELQARAQEATLMVLLRAGADLSHGRTEATQGRDTPLIYAYYSGPPDFRRMLVTLGADLNVPGEGGITPLMCAAEFDPEGMRLMLRHGASRTARDDLGLTPMDHARQSVNLDPQAKAAVIRLLSEPSSEGSRASLEQ